MSKIFIILILFLITGHSYCQENMSVHFDSLVKNADSLSAVENYSQALMAYESAFSIRQTDQLNKKIEYTRRILLKQTEFNQLVAAADSLYKNEEYVDARKMYIQSILIKPSESYVKNRIHEIDVILKKNEE